MGRYITTTGTSGAVITEQSSAYNARVNDRILADTALSGSYTMTLGEENLSNATGNVVLIRIALDSGQSVTALSVS